jgi:3-oxoadipate enol-lactonase
MSADRNAGKSKPELLFLHPIGLDHQVWSAVLPAGARTLDFPGHGSEPPVDKVSIARLADHVLSHITEPVALVGLSLGGTVALQVALRAPGLVTSLLVACCVAASPNPKGQRERANAFRKGMQHVVEGTLARWFTKEALATPGHPGVVYARNRLLQDDAEVVASYWEAMANNTAEPNLSTLRMPTTFIAGTHDGGATPDLMDQMVKLVPGSVLEVIDGPHMLPLERPTEFQAALDRHLRRSH